MAEIRPFKGVRYSQDMVSDLASVLCPPYDIISPLQQNELYARSEHNFVRVEYNRELPQDNAEDNRYTRAAGYLDRWLGEGILNYEQAPAVYFHDHFFTCQGKEQQRRNIIALVRLEEWEKMIVRPHENIIPKAKSDRLSMLRTCRANTSAVLAMFQDPGQLISSLLNAGSAGQPIVDFVDDCGDHHRVRAMTGPGEIERVRGLFASQPLYIADGHHRYDSALTYKREMASMGGPASGEEPFNFVMMSLIDVADPGLVILPSHRLVRGISRSIMGKLKSQLKSFFDLEELPLKDPAAWKKVDTLLGGIKPETEVIRLAVFGLSGADLLVLTLRDHEAVKNLMPTFHSSLYNKLDVSLVGHIVLEKLLGITKDKEENILAYTHDRLEAVSRVTSQEYQLAFILNPVKPELIEAIADAGDRMPRKSTYFYPKSPAGLVFYHWQKE
jgi:uncharacterized protein (DUF1015 family)